MKVKRKTHHHNARFKYCANSYYNSRNLLYLRRNLSCLKPRLGLYLLVRPEFAKVALQALISHQKALNIDIVAVYTQPDRKIWSWAKISTSPVKALALANNIAVEQP